MRRATGFCGSLRSARGGWQWRFFSLLICATCSVAVHGQQDIMISQYLFNGLLLNPAYAGSHSYINSTLLQRSQWTQMEGAPVTSVMAVDGPMAAEDLGLGLLISLDEIGVTSQLDVSVNFAYRLDMPVGKLAFGLRAGATSYRAAVQDVEVWDPSDPVFSGNEIREFIPKFGFGAYYANEIFYIGASVPVLYALDDVLQNGEEDYFKRHLLVTSGVVLFPTERLTLKPTCLVKYVNNAPVEVDLNMHALIDNRFWLGLGYRSGASMVAMFEYQISPTFRTGYAHDFTTNGLRSFTGGSHEIMIGLDLGAGEVKTRSPRYF